MKKTIVCSGDEYHCSYGTLLCPIQVFSNRKVSIDGRLAATEGDNQIQNLRGFGMCSSLKNPQVAAATVMAEGVLTPQPCSPVLAGGWTCLTNTKISGKRTITSQSEIWSAFSGRITNVTTRQEKVTN